MIRPSPFPEYYRLRGFIPADPQIAFTVSGPHRRRPPLKSTGAARPIAVARLGRIPLAISLAIVGAAICNSAASAQSVTFAGPTPSVDFGSVNVCPAGKTTPSPCSKTLTLTYNVSAGGTLGTPEVLTTGASNLDFTLASGSTCTGSVIAGGTCTVKVTFAPRAPGSRKGGVEIVDGRGNLLASTYIYGTGTGPAIAFNPGESLTPVVNLSFIPLGVAVDASGNLFVSANDERVSGWDCLT